MKSVKKSWIEGVEWCEACCFEPGNEMLVSSNHAAGAGVKLNGKAFKDYRRGCYGWMDWPARMCTLSHESSCAAMCTKSIMRWTTRFTIFFFERIFGWIDHADQLPTRQRLLIETWNYRLFWGRLIFNLKLITCRSSKSVKFARPFATDLLGYPPFSAKVSDTYQNHSKGTK